MQSGLRVDHRTPREKLEKALAYANERRSRAYWEWLEMRKAVQRLTKELKALKAKEESACAS